GLRISATVPAGMNLLHCPVGSWALDGKSFRPIAPGLPAPYRDVLEREIPIPEEGVQGFLQREIPLLGEHFDITGLSEELAQEPAHEIAAPREKVRFALNLEGSLNHLVGKLEAHYGESRVTLSSAAERT